MSTETQTIPEDIRDAAESVVSRISYVMPDPGSVRQDIEQAIHDASMSERERCAGLLEKTSARLRAERPGEAAAIIAAVLVECADVIRMPAAPKAEG